jgi:hypothetical protein
VSYDLSKVLIKVSKPWIAIFPANCPSTNYHTYAWLYLPNLLKGQIALNVDTLSTGLFQARLFASDGIHNCIAVTEFMVTSKLEVKLWTKPKQVAINFKVTVCWDATQYSEYFPVFSMLLFIDSFKEKPTSYSLCPVGAKIV